VLHIGLCVVAVNHSVTGMYVLMSELFASRVYI